MILVTGSAETTAEQFAELLAISEAHVARSRLEPGCISHAVYRDVENPNRLVFVEKWASMDALKQHFVVPESRQFGKQVAKLSIAPPTLEVFEANAIQL